MFTCQVNVFTCQINVFTCQINVFTCQINVFTCQVNVFTCQINVFTCQVNVFLSSQCVLVKSMFSLVKSMFSLVKSIFSLVKSMCSLVKSMCSCYSWINLFFLVVLLNVYFSVLFKNLNTNTMKYRFILDKMGRTCIQGCKEVKTFIQSCPSEKLNTTFKAAGETQASFLYGLMILFL